MSASRETWLRRGVALFALCLVGVILWRISGEILDPAPPLNDAVLHQRLAHGASLALERGADPTDFWFPEVALGYPAFHHYQHLPHVTIAVVSRTLGASIESVYAWTTWLLLLLLPLCVGWTAHRLTRDRLTGWCAVALTGVISSPGMYGLDLSSFGWGGSGLVTQLWGAVLLGPTWVCVRRAIRKGRGIAVAGAMIGLLVLTHTVLGWVAAMTAIGFALVGGLATLKQRGLRLALIGGVALVLTAYFVVPFLLDGAALNRSVHEHAWKYDAFGAGETLRKLATGELFDWNLASTIRGVPTVRTPPVITILLGIGLIIALVRAVRRRRAPVLVALFAGWLVVFFGPATWGEAARWLPLADNLHFHRLIVPVHLAGLGVAATALALVFRTLVDWTSRRIAAPAVGILVAVVAIGLLFVPFRERLRSPGLYPPDEMGYVDRRAQWVANTREDIRARGAGLMRAVDRLKRIATGRVYAGLATNWGASYRIGAVPVYALLTGRGIPSVGYLYHAMSLSADLMVYFNELRPAHYNLFNVRHVLLPRDSQWLEGLELLGANRDFQRFGKPVFVEDAHAIVEVKTTGYFDLVSALWSARGDRASWYAAMREWILSAFVESKQHPVLFVDAPPTAGHESALSFEELQLEFRKPPPGPVRRGRVSKEVLLPDGFEAHFTVREPCYLMLKQTYHPGWRARVGDREVTPVMVAPSFCAVPVRPGDTEAVFTYRPPAARRSVAILGVVVTVLFVAGEWWWRRRRRRGAGLESVA